MYSSFFFLYRSKCLPELVQAHKIFTRSMGGGPRTFPGGLNKWQWKRLHEKKAKEKESRLLDQEKQLYQSRIRTQIRSQLAGSGQLDPDEGPDPNTIKYTPMSPKEHVKALADRFMKEGAEDLWNDKDGPLVSDERSGTGGVSHQPGSISSPIDLRKLVPGSGGNASRKDDKSYDLRKFREYSTGRGVGFRPKSGSLARISEQKVRKFRRNESSSSDDDGDYGLLRRDANFHMKLNSIGSNSTQKPLIQKRNESSSGIDDEDESYGFGGGLVKRLVNKSDSVSNSKNVTEYMKGRRLFDQKSWRIQKHGGSDDDDDQGEEENEEERGSGSGRGVREIGSSAALGKYDRKITKRVPLQAVQKEGGGFAKEVESIRYELEKRKKELGENKGEKSAKDREESILSEKRFDESGISPLTIKALTAASYVRMTRVQEATLSVCLEGKDALVKAKTGTGKSAAFLLPAIEAVLKATSSKVNARVHPVYVLILCPTRELASQIAAEANALLKHHIGIGVQTLVGGTRFKVDQKRLESDPCQIIVATPGRLLDHIENRGGITVRLMGLKMLILDEADHLLDLGFRKDMEKIVDCLPRQRQSLLFSATIPKEVRRICQLVLMKEHTFIDTVGMGCVETPVKVKQSFLIFPHELHFQVVHHLLKEHTQQVPDYKVIVFCSTGMVTSLMYQLMRGMKMNVREIHSRKPQLHRTRVSDEFKESKRLILVTSDVSARGMNYPDVTLVIQVGIPSDREQYMHRLGRTGREGKDGEGILLIAPWEKYFLDELQDLPLENFPPPNVDPETKHMVEDSMSKIDSSIREAAYHAWLGYYNSIRETGRDKTTLVELANQFAESIGLPKPPSLLRKTALKMGLKDIPGIRIQR